MPRRTLRDTINTSPHVDKLDFASEVLYRRLMSEVDDYGRMEALPVIIRSKCFPLRVDRIRETDLVRSLAACQDADLIRIYEVSEAGVSRQIPSVELVAGSVVLGHNSFLVMLRVEPPRAIHSKHPEPPGNVICWRPTGVRRKPGAYKRLSESAIACAQMQTNASYSYSYSYSNPPPPESGGDGDFVDAPGYPEACAIIRDLGVACNISRNDTIELARFVVEYGEPKARSALETAHGAGAIGGLVRYAGKVLASERFKERKKAKQSPISSKVRIYE